MIVTSPCKALNLNNPLDYSTDTQVADYTSGTRRLGEMFQLQDEVRTHDSSP